MALILTNGTGGGNWVNAATWSGGVVPVFPNTAQVVLGDTIDQVPAGQECTTNYGTITANNGNVMMNAVGGVVSAMPVGAGWVRVNNGTVSLMALGTTVSTNNGTVGSNQGMVAENAVAGIVTLNGASPGPGIDPGIVTDNWGLVLTNNGRVENLMTLAAISGGTRIHPGAFGDPGAGNVRSGTSYNFDSAAVVGTLAVVVDYVDSQPYAPGPDGRILSGHNAGMVIAYNDDFSKFSDNVGKP